MENTPDEGKIEVIVRNKGEGSELVVHDYGVGITEEYQRRIFEGFFTTRESKNSFDTLSQRERQVFQLLAEGKGIKEIANELFISPKTVESHKYHIMEKLQAASIIDLTKLAIRKKLIKV